LPAHDLALLTEAALKAGEIAMRFWKRSPKSWDKGGGHGPVTEADLDVNEMLAAKLLAARPDYGWLSEETEDGAARLAAERVFIIDPIDGTRAFMAGEDTFAHSLAVAEHGRVTAAVVYLPALWRNPRPVLARSRALVPWLQASGLPRERLVQALGVSLLVSALSLTLVLGGAGHLGLAEFWGSSLALLPALLGQGLGSMLRRRLNEALFRRCFFAGLVLLGLHLVWRAWP
jgi:voltage-gated potassium channel Kch